jgi:hypothetical protein
VSGEDALNLVNQHPTLLLAKVQDWAGARACEFGFFFGGGGSIQPTLLL